MKTPNIDGAKEYVCRLSCVPESVIDEPTHLLRAVLVEHDRAKAFADVEMAELRADLKAIRDDWAKYRLALNRIAHPDIYPEAAGICPKEIARRALVIGMNVSPLPTKNSEA